MRSRIRERIEDSGIYRDVKIYSVYADAPKGRRRRFRPTSEVQQRLNDWNSEQHLNQLIETNFTERDVWIHPTFRDDALPADDADFKRIFRNYVRRLGRAYKRASAELKYIAILERSEKGRYHIHMIVNSVLPAAELRDIWGLGRLTENPLEFSDVGLKGLADYMTKYRVITRRYLRSRNLREPERQERDGRYTKKKVRELARNPEDREQWETLYPGYTFIRCMPYYNPVNGGIYITVRMWRPQERRRKWNTAN